VSTLTFPVPWQSGVVVCQGPEGTVPVWSSKSEQIVAPAHSAGAVAVAVAVGEAVAVGVGLAVPPHGVPLRAKAVGAGSAVRQVPWSPKSTDPPTASTALCATFTAVIRVAPLYVSATQEPLRQKGRPGAPSLVPVQ